MKDVGEIKINIANLELKVNNFDDLRGRVSVLEESLMFMSDIYDGIKQKKGGYCDIGEIPLRKLPTNIQRC